MRAALNSPAASPACDGGTDEIAAWFRNNMPRIVPTPRSNWLSVKEPPVESAVSTVSIPALSAMMPNPRPTAMRISTFLMRIGVNGIIKRLGIPLSSTTLPAWNALYPAIEARNCGIT